MDLELLLKRKTMKDEINYLENLQDCKEELKKLKKQLIDLEKEIKLQCQKDGHFFENKWECYENEIGIGNMKLKKELYERTCDICGKIQKTKKISLKK